MKMREAAAVNMQDAELTDGNGSKIDSEMLLENVQRIAKQSFVWTPHVRRRIWCVGQFQS